MTDSVGKIIDDAFETIDDVIDGVFKRCRNLANGVKAPKLRFCTKCLFYARKFKVEEEMFRQAREGLWICPNAKEQCGKRIT